MSDVSDTAERSPETLGAAPSGRHGPSILSRAGAILLNQREATITLIAVILFIYFAATTPSFFSHGSFVNIGQYMAPYVIIGIGLVLVMVCGEIDLSVGFVWTLSPFVMHFFVDSGLPTVLAIVVTVLVLSLIGLINGVVTTIFGVPSLITTLATGYIVFGYTLTISSAQQINLPTQSVGIGHWFGGEAWSEIIWATVLVLIFQVLLRRTRWGLYTVSVGGNILGAREAGIKVNRIKIGNFMMCSSLGALAGILEAFKNDIADPSAGQLAVVLTGIAAAVIGGTAMLGGVGTMIGMWFGALVLGELQDGFNLRGISSYKYLIIEGAAIIVFMIANTYLTKLRGSGRLVGTSSSRRTPPPPPPTTDWDPARQVTDDAGGLDPSRGE
jgi:simple sugar transport system permease protein